MKKRGLKNTLIGILSLLMVCQCSRHLQPNDTYKSRVYAAGDVPRNKSARCGSVGRRP